MPLAPTLFFVGPFPSLSQKERETISRATSAVFISRRYLTHPISSLPRDFGFSTWVQEHIFEFEEAPSVEAVASQLSTLALKFNGYDKDGKSGSGGRDDDDGGLAMSRPVGVALLMAGIDRGNCPVLFHLDPSGERPSFACIIFHFCVTTLPCVCQHMSYMTKNNVGLLHENRRCARVTFACDSSDIVM